MVDIPDVNDDVVIKGMPDKDDTDLSLSKPITYTEDGQDRCLDVTVCNADEFPGGDDDNSDCDKDFRIRYSGTNVTMPSSYATIHSYTGSGWLHGFALDFNSDSVRVRLTIDGEENFALTLDEVEGMQAFSSSGCDDDSGPANALCGIIKKASGNRLYFCKKLKFETSVLIEGQRSSGSNKTLDKKMIFISEVT